MKHQAGAVNKKEEKAVQFGMRAVLAVVVLLTEIVFLFSLGSAGVEFVLSSMVVTAALLIQIRFGMQSDAATPADLVIFIFNWLFLDLAPKIQLLSVPGQLVNTSTVTESGVLITNLLCSVFIVSFTCTYAWLVRRSRGPLSTATTVVASTPQSFSAFGVFVAVFASVLVVLVAAPYAYATVKSPASSSPPILVLNRFLLFLPSATFLILVNETIGTRRKLMFSRVCVLLVLLVLIALTENPYTEKRNALGPLYLGMLFVTYQSYFRSQNRRCLLLIASMVLVFPAISIFTHNGHQSLGQTFETLNLKEIVTRIEDHYFSINYDAWANIYTSVEMERSLGLQWGHQVLGSFLFFVPSAVWTTKPLATGIFIGDYLIRNYSMWFNNLSGPLVAEAYLDFGAAGVVLYGAISAAFVAFMNKLVSGRRNWAVLPIGMYAAVFLMFLLRGSLMVAMAFGTAALLSFFLALRLLSARPGSLQQHVLTAPHQSRFPRLVRQFGASRFAGKVKPLEGN